MRPNKLIFSLLITLLSISMIITLIYWNNISINEFKKSKNSIDELLQKISFKNTFTEDAFYTGEKYNLLTLGSEVSINFGNGIKVFALLNYNLTSNIPEIVESYNHEYELKTKDWITEDRISFKVPDDTSLLGRRFILNLEVERMILEQEKGSLGKANDEIIYYTTNDISSYFKTYETIILEESTIKGIKTESESYNRFLFGNIFIIQISLLLLLTILYHSKKMDNEDFFKTYSIVYFSCAGILIIFSIIIAGDFIKQPIGTFIGYVLLSGLLFFFSTIYMILYDYLIRLFDNLFKTHNARALI